MISLLSVLESLLDYHNLHRRSSLSVASLVSPLLKKLSDTLGAKSSFLIWGKTRTRAKIYFSEKAFLGKANFFSQYSDEEFLELISEKESLSLHSKTIEGLNWEILPLRTDEIEGVVGFCFEENSEFSLKNWASNDWEQLNRILLLILDNSALKNELGSIQTELEEYTYKVNEDLELARNTQSNLVSVHFPDSRNYHFSSYFRPMELVGGDIISFYNRGEELDILFADVSGHGISAAMVSGMVILSFRNSSKLGLTPREGLESAHKELASMIVNHHVSAAYIRYNPILKKFTYSYAGHPPIALLRGGKCEPLEMNNSPLLVPFELEFQDITIDLQSKDRLVFYSDGFFEIFNNNGKMLGLEGFFEILTNLQKIPKPDDFINEIVNEITRYSENRVQDDMALLVLDIP